MAARWLLTLTLFVTLLCATFAAVEEVSAPSSRFADQTPNMSQVAIEHSVDGGLTYTPRGSIQYSRTSQNGEALSNSLVRKSAKVVQPQSSLVWHRSFPLRFQPNTQQAQLRSLHKLGTNGRYYVRVRDSGSIVSVPVVGLHVTTRVLAMS